jgi:hypothetical protein
MRKTIILTLLACLAVPVFADQAIMLPAGMLRLTVVPSFAFAPGAYGTSGNYSAYGADQGYANVLNAGGAIEYGITDWINLGVQWAPGWNITSSVNLPIGSSGVNIDGFYDMIVGTKLQWIGEKAPIKSETIRFCLSPGFMVPLGGANFQTQFANVANGGGVTVINPDKQVWGVGGRLDADYVFGKAFYLNLYSQFLYLLGTVPLEDTSLPGYVSYLHGQNPNVGYGYELTVETEPHYIYALSEGVHLEGSLPFTLTYSPNLSYNGVTQANTAQALLVVRPTLDLFFLKSVIPFPLEFKLAYSLPFIGNDTIATNAVILIVRAYL